MAKSLKGKGLGKNISQRKDGRYQARFCISGIRCVTLVKTVKLKSWKAYK